jgi:two-component system response regulator YesN
VKILVVEDEPEPREGLCQLLQTTSPDWDVLPPCCSGDEGLNAVEAHRPDLVITDIRMPNLDGLDMIAALRRAENEPSVIVLSGYPDFEYARRCLSLGVRDYLLKPVTAKVIVAAVRAVEDGHWTDAALRDWLDGKTDLADPGLLLLFRSSVPLSTVQKKTLRREVAGLTGNPNGTLVAESPHDGELFFWAKGVADLPRSLAGRFLETLRPRVRVPLVGGALAVSGGDGRRKGEILRKSLKRFLMRPSPGFLWGAPNREPASPVAYPLTLEKDLNLALNRPGMAPPLLERFQTDLFRVGFEPSAAVQAGQRLFFFLQKRLENLDTAKFELFQALSPAVRLENALDNEEVVRIFSEVAGIFDLPNVRPGPLVENPKIQSALTLIEKRLNDPPTLAECASELGMSGEYLSRLFKAEMGTGYAKYVMGRRIERAKALIADSPGTIQQISASLGFQNAKYFCAIFRKETGLTPTEYRSRFA